MNCNTTHYRANSSSVPGDPTARSPVEGVRSIRPGETVRLDRRGPSVVAGSRDESPNAPPDPASATAVASAASHVDAAVAAVLAGDVDLPSMHAIRAECAARSVEAAGGGVASLAVGDAAEAGRAFARATRRVRRPARRPKAPADALHVEAQRALELEAYREVPVNWAHAFTAPFPAATRAALATLGSRVGDGIRPLGRGEPAVTETVERAFVGDVVLRATESALRARGLDAAVAALPSWPRTARSDRALAEAIDASVRGRHADRVAALLARDRVAAGGVLRPEATADAVDRWRGRRDGWSSERVAFLASIVAWIERERLAPPRAG